MQRSCNIKLIFDEKYTFFNLNDNNIRKAITALENADINGVKRIFNIEVSSDFRSPDTLCYTVEYDPACFNITAETDEDEYYSLINDINDAPRDIIEAILIEIDK